MTISINSNVTELIYILLYIYISKEKGQVRLMDIQWKLNNL